MTAEMKNFSFDEIQLEAESFAANYRKTHDVPPFPSGDQLQKYKEILSTKYSRVVELVKKRLEEVDSEGGHGYEHLEDVATRAGFIAETECDFRGIKDDQKEEIINETVLAGLLHDIERHLGFGEDHMINGADTAMKILTQVGIGSEVVATVVRNHDHMDFNPTNPTMEIVFGSVFDADHFRYGLEREDTFWRMKEKKGKTPPEVIHDYQFLPAYTHAWKTSYGKEVGPKYIEFGLAVAKYVEETFGV
jgi:hypothetical protein